MQDPIEYRLLDGVRAALAAAVGSSYQYDASGAYVVPAPQVQFLGEIRKTEPPKTLYLVSPSDVNFTEESTCATLATGDLLVTAAVRYETPELPWRDGYVPQALHQLRMLDDIFTALHMKTIAGATLAVASRQLDLLVDGFATVQVVVGFTYTTLDQQ